MHSPGFKGAAVLLAGVLCQNQLRKTGCIDNVQFVDGTEMRDHVDTDFMGGSNPRANPKYCPPGTVLLEKGFNRKDTLAFLVHELAEYHAMSKPEKYPDAHAHANAVEGKFRQIADAGSSPAVVAQ